MENVHWLGLNHVGCPPSWTSHVPHRNFYRGPCHWICHCLYPGALQTMVSVPNYAQGASPTRHLCRRCWNGGLNNYQKERTPHPGPSSKTASCLPFWFLEVAHQVRWTQLCPEMMLPEVEKAAGAQAQAEGSEPPTPSIGLLPRQ